MSTTHQLGLIAAAVVSVAFAGCEAGVRDVTAPPLIAALAPGSCQPGPPANPGKPANPGPPPGVGCRPIDAVSVTPEDSNLTSGSAIQLSATLTDRAGNPITDRQIQWGSSDPSVATVDLTGGVSAFRPGAATITATSDNVTGSATVTVVPGVFSMANRCISAAFQACATIDVTTIALPTGGTQVDVTFVNSGSAAAYLSALRFGLPVAVISESSSGSFTPSQPTSWVNTPVTGSSGAGGDWLTDLVVSPTSRLLFQSHIGLDSDFGYDDPLATYVGDGFWGCSVQAPVGVGAISGYTTCGTTPSSPPNAISIRFHYASDFQAADLVFQTLGFWTIDGLGQLEFRNCSTLFGPGCVDL